MKQILLKDKKGQLGMNVAKAFLLGLMTLLVIGVTVLIVMNSLGDTSFALDSFTVANETGGYVNSSAYTLADASAYGFTSLVVSAVRNGTDGVAIVTGNYTVTAAGVVTNTTAVSYNSALFDYTYEANNEIISLTDNSSTGIVDFFASTTTWLSLLGIVVIILLIAVVISVVNRFEMKGGEKSGGVTF